jgi:hypothetical protein
MSSTTDERQRLKAGISSYLRTYNTPERRIQMHGSYLGDLIERGYQTALERGVMSDEDSTKWQKGREFAAQAAKQAPTNFLGLATLIGKSLTASDVQLAIPVDERVRALFPEFLYLAHSMVFDPPEGLPIKHDQMASDLEEFLEFAIEFNAETDRGAALVGAALVDDRLLRLLQSHLVASKITEEMLDDSPTAALGTFSARMNLCYALGLITRVEHRECGLIRKVRNMFAHKTHGLKFANPKITDLCFNLRGYAAGGGDARVRFVNSVIALCMVLWYRPMHAIPFKAEARQWLWHLADDSSRLIDRPAASSEGSALASEN